MEISACPTCQVDKNLKNFIQRNFPNSLWGYVSSTNRILLKQSIAEDLTSLNFLLIYYFKSKTGQYNTLAVKKMSIIQVLEEFLTILDEDNLFEIWTNYFVYSIKKRNFLEN